MRQAQVFDYPGATYTYAYGIDGNNLVGTYTDASGKTYGFLAVVPEPVSSILFVTGEAVLAGRRFLKKKGKSVVKTICNQTCI